MGSIEPLEGFYLEMKIWLWNSEPFDVTKYQNPE